MNDKEFLLCLLDTERLRSLAEGWGFPIRDQRLRAPGIAKELARKRSLTVQQIVDAMAASELAAACTRVGLAPTGGAATMRTRLLDGLSRSGWKALRREAVTAQLKELVALPAELLDVIDGDTLRVRVEGEVTLVRIRGIDTPETTHSDKAEEDLDRASMDHPEMVALGLRATERLKEIIRGRTIYLHCQPTPLGPKRYLHHHQYRLLAFVSLDEPGGPDVGDILLREGYALVWPRNVKTRRYLHVRSEAYVTVCNHALRTRPGLWKSGLAKLCPRHEEPGRGGWTLQDCRDRCLQPPEPAKMEPA